MQLDASRCRPAPSNETNLATRQEFYFTKVATAQSINGILLCGFFINTAFLDVYFILHYDLFFHKEINFFECLCSSEYSIWMSLYVFLVGIEAVN